ncbi:hypothetical protein GPROT1_04105 [Gammaproteobacteria bacterium]|nr:hypothetical protein GPROT1_04105 [Gammaproteobacteria bacterium]
MLKIVGNFTHAQLMGSCSARLLDNMGQLVCKQPITFMRLWAIVSAPKKDIPPYRVSKGVQLFCRPRRVLIVMDAHFAEVFSKPRFHEGLYTRF